jgi:hypothetical protein
LERPPAEDSQKSFLLLFFKKEVLAFFTFLKFSLDSHAIVFLFNRNGETA